MFYKQNIFISTILLITVTLIFTGCDGTEEPKEEVSPFSGNYSKIAADGSVLENENIEPEQPVTEWDCVRFNQSGIVWMVQLPEEMDTAKKELRDKNTVFTWYDSSSTNKGTASTGCEADSCDTEKYIKWANDNAICGVKNWHLPSIDDMQSIVQYYSENPSLTSINKDLFPNTFHGFYWSSDEYENDDNKAYGILFSQAGSIAVDFKSNANSVRLVGSL